MQQVKMLSYYSVVYDGGPSSGERIAVANVGSLMCDVRGYEHVRCAPAASHRHISDYPFLSSKLRNSLSLSRNVN